MRALPCEPDEQKPSNSGGIPVFDLHEAVSRCFGKHEFFLDMVSCFFGETDGMMHLLQDAQQKNNFEEVRTLAHRMKNTIVYLGAGPATQAIQDLEHEAKACAAAGTDKALQRLFAELQRLKQSLSDFRSRDAIRTNSQ
jgi:hypothetical protein